jgi:multidrug resistance efflux pump
MIHIQSTVTGQVREVLVRRGQEVAPGDAAFVVVDGAGREHTIELAFGGRVDTIETHRGHVVTPGTDLVTVEPSGPDGTLVGFAFVPQDQVGNVAEGQPTDILPGIAQSYGAFKGRVAEIDPVPVAREELEALLSDDDAVDAVLANGRPVLVRIELERAQTPSGLAWHTGEGPPFRLQAGTPVSIEISQGDERPIDTLFGSG